MDASIEASHVALSASTGSPVIGVFHTSSAGNAGHERTREHRPRIGAGGSGGHEAGGAEGQHGDDRGGRDCPRAPTSAEHPHRHRPQAADPRTSRPDRAPVSAPSRRVTEPSTRVAT